MSLRLYDISRDLHSGMAVWPGDAPFERRVTGKIVDGSSVNVSVLTLSAHCGTHVDAPYHYSDDGQTMEHVDLSVYWGPAQVVTVEKTSGALVPADFEEHEIGRAARLLIHSPASAADPTVFHDDFVYPSPELADYLGGLGIRLFGTDAPSVDDSKSKTLPGHAAMLRNGILILEGLKLDGVPDGLYDLSAFPLRVMGGDGSPVRAVLRALE